MSKIITTKDKRVNEIFEMMQKRRELERDKGSEIKKNWNTIKAAGFGYVKTNLPSATLNYDEGRMLYDVLPDGSWKDQRCFILGGGESLKNFDFSKLKGELVIGVNRAYELMDCMVNFAMDYNLHGWITKGRLGKKAKEKFEDYEGYPVWLDAVGYDYPKGIFILNKSNSPAFSYSMKEGIGGGTNSGFGALNLAVCLGASPIYLLGFDMKGKDGRQSWWHDGYPDKRSDDIYGMFINDFKRVASELMKRGTQIINLNADSELKCFEFGRFEDIEPIDRPIIASYYTKGSEYETQIRELKSTLRRYNLESDIVGIKSLGDWYKNTYYKSQFVLEVLKRHPNRSVVFVDADAIFRQYPVLFSNFDCDFAYHYYNRKELLGGTLYFGNTKGARYVAKKWVEIDKEYQKTHMPQKNLQELFKRIKNEIKYKELPIEYCMIFDCHQRYRQNLRPVIEHFQLSRKHKEQNLRSSRYRLKGGLLKIQKLCKGKKMCIIGNADSVLKKKKNIDSYDIIGRMNRGKPVGKETYIGSRTDILFLSTGISRKGIEVGFGISLKDHTIAKNKYVVWMTANHRLAHPWVIRNAIQNPKKDWHELHKKLGINPTTGMMTLKFVLQYLDFESLTIYGFDFFATKSWYNTKVDSGLKHSGAKERVLFMKMIKDRKNVRFVQ